MARIAISVLTVAWALALSSCTSDPKLGRWDGPASAVNMDTQSWLYADQPAKILRTQHYRIHTTIQDDQTVDLLPQLMEGALERYRQLTPGLPVSRQPMDCYVFRNRAEWDHFTRKTTGKDAAIYLQIRSGGYTVADTYVSYYIGRASTFSVAAHEGWHQYCGRHFKGRLPPFLEEGIACMFESVTWDRDLPRFNISVNPHRALSLKKAMENGDLFPLSKLISTHAGDIVGEKMERIDAFYAQSWAFARYLWEGENRAHRPALQKWLNETADGTVYDPTRSHSRGSLPWNRRAVKPMMEHYLGKSLDEIEKGYSAYMQRIVREELKSQWRS